MSGKLISLSDMNDADQKFDLKGDLLDERIYLTDPE